MRTPIIVAEANDLSFYASLEDVEWHLEAIDVDNGEFVAYDADGRHVPLSTKRLHPRKFLGMISVPGAEVVVASAPEEEPRHAKDLRRVLVRYLNHWEPIPALEQKTLGELIGAGIDKAGLERAKPKKG